MWTLAPVFRNYFIYSPPGLVVADQKRALQHSLFLLFVENSLLNETISL